MSNLANSLDSLRRAAIASDEAWVEEWLSEWALEDPSPFSDLIARTIGAVEKLVGTGGRATARLVSEFLIHVERQGDLSESARQGYLAGSKWAANAIRSTLEGLRAEPDLSQVRESCLRGLTPNRQAVDSFSYAIDHDADMLFPSITAMGTRDWQSGIAVPGHPVGLQDKTRVDGARVCVYGRGLTLDDLEQLRHELTLTDAALVVFAPDIEPTLNEYSQHLGRRVCFFNVSESPGSLKRIAEATDTDVVVGRRVEPGRADRIAFDASTATIVNPIPSHLSDARLLVTGFADADQAWTSLDRNFRRYKAISSSGVIQSSALNRCREIVLEQAVALDPSWLPGAAALVGATQSVLDRPGSLDVPLHALTAALPLATEVAASVLSLTSRGAGPLSPPRDPPLTVNTSEPPEDPQNATLPERVLDVLLTGDVKPEARVTLTAIIRLLTSKLTGQRSATFSVDPSAGPVLFGIEATGFEVEGTRTRERIIPEREDTEPVAFILKVLAASERWIEITLFQRNTPLTQVTLTSFDLAEITKRQNLPILADVDLTLTISNTYEVTASSPPNQQNLSELSLGKLKEPDSLPRRLSSYLEWLYTATGNPSDLEHELRIIGANLRDLLPHDLREHLSRPNLESILIRHEIANVFPFELVLLEDDEGEFVLADRLIVCRWLRGIENAPTSGVKIIKQAALFKGQVDVAANEFTLLRKLCSSTTECASVEDVRREVFRTSSYELLHFIGHCKESQELGVYLELEKGQLRLLEIGALRDEKLFGQASPVVVINGCGTARVSPSLFGEGSLPERFLRNKASMFVGTLWPVDKRIAHEFARTFYGSLRLGRSIGRAVLETRQQLRDATAWIDGDPITETEQVYRRISLRSYCVFAHPAMSISFPHAA